MLFPGSDEYGAAPLSTKLCGWRSHSQPPVLGKSQKRSRASGRHCAWLVRPGISPLALRLCYPRRRNWGGPAPTRATLLPALSCRAVPGSRSSRLRTSANTRRGVGAGCWRRERAGLLV